MAFILRTIVKLLFPSVMCTSVSICLVKLNMHNLTVITVLLEKLLLGNIWCILFYHILYKQLRIGLVALQTCQWNSFSYKEILLVLIPTSLSSYQNTKIFFNIIYRKQTWTYKNMVSGLPCSVSWYLLSLRGAHRNWSHMFCSHVGLWNHYPLVKHF